MSLQGKQQLAARLTAIGNTQIMLRDVQIHAVRYAKLKVPHRTGNLRRTIRVGSLTVNSCSIYAGGQNHVGYAGAVELGRKAVTIRPKTQLQRREGPFLRGQKGQHVGGVLAWGGPRRLSGSLRSGGKPTNFAREVHQPARKGTPYLLPGMAQAAQGIPGTIVTRWNAAA